MEEVCRTAFGDHSLRLDNPSRYNWALGLLWHASYDGRWSGFLAQTAALPLTTDIAHLRQRGTVTAII
jgi:hypothetical protein